MHLCVLGFRFHVCVCNSTPICFLVWKESGKVVRAFGKELNFMKIWSGEMVCFLGGERYKD